jgi:hypothetical protein
LDASKNRNFIKTSLPMLQELIELEERFKPYLLNNDYTFIGPADQNLFEPFMRRANNLAPVVSILRSIHHFLSDKEATRQALSSLPAGTPLRIFVVTHTPQPYDNMLLHDTIEGYVQKNNIDFQP